MTGEAGRVASCELQVASERHRKMSFDHELPRVPRGTTAEVLQLPVTSYQLPVTRHHSHDCANASSSI
jgi:hypothetical protein